MIQTNNDGTHEAKLKPFPEGNGNKFKKSWTLTSLIKTLLY
jgi:hypothetical protein